MTITNTAYQDQNRQPPFSELEKKVNALPHEWRMRYHAIFLGQPKPPVVTQEQSYLQVLSEMEHPDDCACVLPEQSCPACRAAAILIDEELPY